MALVVFPVRPAERFGGNDISEFDDRQRWIEFVRMTAVGKFVADVGEQRARPLTQVPPARPRKGVGVCATLPD